MARDGTRTGGRKPGAMNKQAPEVKELARLYTGTAIAELASIAVNPKVPPIVRIAACNSLLDRGWGKPAQTVEAQLNKGEGWASVSFGFPVAMIERRHDDIEAEAEPDTSE